MQFTSRELREIVGRASSIFERLRPGFLVPIGAADASLIERRLARWRQLVARDDPQQFSRRLAWDGLGQDALGPLLGSVLLAEDQPFPAWAQSLGEIVRSTISSRGESTSSPALDVPEPLPFADILKPVVVFARRQLTIQPGVRPDLCSGKTDTAFERSLFELLADLCGPALQFEFSLFRALRRSRLDQIVQPGPKGSRILYDQFVAHLLEGGLVAFFREYAVLARLLATTVDFWIDAVREFLVRLASDRPAIQDTFQNGADLGPVVAAQPFLSDPHHSGRGVFAVQFACGLRLIYKPRTVGPEQAFFELLAWLNRRGSPLGFKILRVLDRSDHGWVEYAQNEPCGDEQEVRRYYQRAGILLCVVHMLKGTDCHFENLIACGENPVLIDLETVMYPQVRPLSHEQNSSASAATEMLRNSVLTTGLLPLWEVTPSGQLVDSGGLSGTGEQPSSYRNPRWTDVNTDDMVLRFEEIQVLSMENAPRLAGSLFGPSVYTEEIVDGFSRMYRLLVQLRPLLLSPDGPLAAFRGLRGRWVFRDTRIYGLLLLKLLRPELLRHGVDRSIELEALGRALLNGEERRGLWDLHRAEQESLFQQDIPHFTTILDGDALVLAPGKNLEQFFTASGFELATARLKQMSDPDIERQVGLIRMSLYSRHSQFAGRADSIPTAIRSGAMAADDVDRLVPLSSQELIAQAAALAQELRSSAILSDDGSAEWIGLNYVSATQREPIRLIGNGLYDGCCGVALFCAALGNITGRTEYRDLTLASLQWLRRSLKEPSLRQKLARDSGLGAAGGLGGIVYALTWIAKFLNESSLLDQAEEAASAITREAISNDLQLDVLGGVAGGILGLLTLYNVRPHRTILNTAIACGQHLLNRRVSSPSGPRAWPTLEKGKLFTGFSHGAAGIAYSLVRLYGTTGDIRFLEAADEAIAFERSVFSREQKNWAISTTSVNETEPPLYFAKWCYGAPGIGLARLGVAAVVDDSHVREEIEFAIETTQHTGLDDVDGLCCGNIGRVEVLLTAAARLQRPALLRHAQQRAAAIVGRGKKNGRFYLFENLPKGITHPGFFQGTAGIGYTLLRLASPAELPSVLLWE